ncbi:uncharacterized protein LOC131941677 [Physella acuta]|uniref:uncharacterized protein LOC131941677 n=1 Tax=Physella acuta TaxID=109671 RepID=UPI0027DBECE3|nr:uncharacterized protein LOC131941677 [Physella acuta]
MTNPVLSDGQDLFSTLRHSKCSTVITSAGNPTFKIFEKYFTSSNGVWAGGKNETIIPVQCDQAPWLKQLIVYKLNSHEDHTAFLSRLADEEFYVAPVTADDEAYIFLTSGSTGFSKMVPRTHGECLDIAENYSSIFTKDDVMYSDRPFGWIGGFPHYFLSQGIPTLVQELYDGVTLRKVADVWDVVLRLGATFTFTLVADIMQLKEVRATFTFTLVADIMQLKEVRVTFTFTLVADIMQLKEVRVTFTFTLVADIMQLKEVRATFTFTLVADIMQLKEVRATFTFTLVADIMQLKEVRATFTFTLVTDIMQLKEVRATFTFTLVADIMQLKEVRATFTFTLVADIMQLKEVRATFTFTLVADIMQLKEVRATFTFTLVADIMQLKEVRATFTFTLVADIMQLKEVRVTFTFTLVADIMQLKEVRVTFTFTADIMQLKEVRVTFTFTLVADIMQLKEVRVTFTFTLVTDIMQLKEVRATFTFTLVADIMQLKEVRATFTFTLVADIMQLKEVRATFTFTLVADIMQLKELYKDGVLKKPIKVIFTGAQPIKKNVIDVVGLVCERMMTTYGSTDVGLMVYGLVDAQSKDKFKDCYAGNTICPDLQLRLVDEKTKEIFTEPNRTGIIHFKGKTVLRRYLNVEDTTAGVFTEDGWLDTKDAGYIDENGGIHVIGRQADIINNGPFILYPQWMEERIQKCPGVQSVMVVGLPHPLTIQELCVCVIKEKDATLTLADLKNFCQGIFLEGATKFDGVPEKFVFMESFPLLSSGKVSRKAVEKEAVEYFKMYSN